MDLRDRIDALLPPSIKGKQEDEKHRRIEELRSNIDRILGKSRVIKEPRPKPEPLSLDEILAGRTVETKSGTVFMTEHHYPSDYSHGNRRLDEILDTPTDRLPIFIGEATGETLSLSDAIFIDTETTGLSGGTGTYVFLLGAGFFTDKGFSICQYFMRDFNEEPGLLHLVSRMVRDGKWVVTFNGKAFDLNLLATRFTLNRMPFPFTHIPHWDLLGTSRCIFKPRIGSCTLANIEREVIGFERHGDIPGVEIPAIYHNFIRNGDAGPLPTVFHHNLLDILSMVTIATLLLKGIHHKDFVREFTPWEFLGFGRMLAAFDHVAACQIWQHGLSLRGNEEIEYCLNKEISRAAKRTGDLDKAVKLWREMLKRPLLDPYVHEELAKYLEHKEKDYDNALALVEEALMFFGHIDRWREFLEYRKKRLRVKRQRQRQGCR